jgi:hypothetical protein
MSKLRETNPFILLYRQKGLPALVEALRAEPIQTPALVAATRILDAFAEGGR